MATLFERKQRGLLGDRFFARRRDLFFAG